MSILLPMNCLHVHHKVGFQRRGIITIPALVVSDLVMLIFYMSFEVLLLFTCVLTMGARLRLSNIMNGLYVRLQHGLNVCWLWLSYRTMHSVYFVDQHLSLGI